MADMIRADEVALPLCCCAAYPGPHVHLPRMDAGFEPVYAMPPAPQPGSDARGLSPDDVLSGPQDLDGLGRLLMAQPKAESLDHLLDDDPDPVSCPTPALVRGVEYPCRLPAGHEGEHEPRRVGE